MIDWLLYPTATFANFPFAQTIVLVNLSVFIEYLLSATFANVPSAKKPQIVDKCLDWLSEHLLTPSFANFFIFPNYRASISISVDWVGIYLPPLPPIFHNPKLQSVCMYLGWFIIYLPPLHQWQMFICPNYRASVSIWRYSPERR